MKNPFIDLFAGCGGLSLGLEQAGFNPVYVNELNNDALNTYLVNRSEYKYLNSKEFHSNDIKELSGSKKRLEELSKNLKSKFNIKKGLKPIFFESIGDQNTPRDERLKKLINVLEKNGFKIKNKKS